MKLLLIEDNRRLADLVKMQINKVHLVDVVHTGQEGIDKATHLEYAVIILDLRLPDMSGLDICMRIREANVDTPILVLTANDEMASRVQLLNSGADDYLTKPFNITELQARIGALARRQQRRYVGSTLKLKDLTIDVDQRKVYRSGIHIPLRRKEFDILEYLVNNSGRVLTREMILNHAWDSNKDSWNSTVDVHIKHLRDKIDRPFKSHLIKTAYGLGYRVDAPE